MAQKAIEQPAVPNLSAPGEFDLVPGLPRAQGNVNPAAPPGFLGDVFLMGLSISSLYGDGSKPCTPGEPQNSWDLWMFIPLKMVSIGIDPYPYVVL